MALKTKGRPAILLLEMLKLMSFSPTAVIMSERHVDEAALRDDAVDGWRFGNVIEHKIINCRYPLLLVGAGKERKCLLEREMGGKIVKVEVSGGEAG